MAKVNKYYVVWRGHEPGIYTHWDDAKRQILNFPNARYKSFKTEKEAYNAYIAGESVSSKSNKKAPSNNAKIILDSWSVDAACSGNPGVVEYQCVHTKTKELVFHMGPFQEGTNNLGEFLGLVHALALLYKQDHHNWPIYTDSKTAMAWVRNKRVKTVLSRTAVNAPIFKLVDRAIHWLNTHNQQNPIYKWDTKNWGEIPADFGRK